MISEHQIAEARMLWAFAGAVPAVIEDLWRRRISNTVCIMLFCGGLILGTLELGVRGLSYAVLGAVGGFSIFLVFYLIRAMGGGDVKLMAGYGALLGIHDVILAAVIAAIAGAIVASGSVALAHFRSRRAESIPYAPAIAVAALTVLLSRVVGGH